MSALYTTTLLSMPVVALHMQGMCARLSQKNSSTAQPAQIARSLMLFHARVQPQLGRYGLFTVMNVAKKLGGGPRGWAACNILRNVQWHYRNVTLFYHAELRVKYEQVLEAAQARSS